ncbi:hypothetical protein [Paraburkholderia sediminicola]|uniref:hypothetical protein n=1 Tax=Paraburkholderia sediminicola TaxID=458836 RepID=UPI000EB1E076
MYLSSEFLEWYPKSEGGAVLEVDAVFRAYEIWRHARDRVVLGATDLDCIDAIGALRRAVNHRLKFLRSTYNFDHLPSTLGKKQTMERLQEFGIVRSAIIKDLLDVRNLIEHEDSEPPDIKQCRYYVDIVWYFLKSTDKLLDYRAEYLNFSHEDDKQFVELEVDHANGWRAKIRAKVEPELISESVSPGAIFVDDVEKTENSTNGLFWMTGKASFTGDQLVRLARGCFSSVGYWHDDNDA